MIAKTTTIPEIPLIDFGPFLNGSPQEQRKVAVSLDKAFMKSGFVYLQNHGIPVQKVDECFSWNKKFFDLPQPAKQLAPHPPGGSHHRGFSGVGVEKISQHVFDRDQIDALRKVPDVKESFESGNIDDPDQPNIWLPERELPGFRSFMEGFFLDCAQLIHHVLDAFSVALELPSKTQLSKTHNNDLFQLRLLHYPSVSRELLRQGQKSRIAAHSDFGTLSLLFQDAIGGLEVEDPHEPGKFHPVPPVPGTVIVNIADLMDRWSNRRWKSSVHRVVAPPPEQGNDGKDSQDMCPSRRSIVFFATANRDVIIDALPGCWDDAENPKLYDPISAEGYVQMRMAALYE